MAQEAVPPSHWKKTPVVLKATAGLRLLAEHKAQALLSEVRLDCIWRVENTKPKKKNQFWRMQTLA